MKKNSGKKSRATVPLRKLFSKKLTLYTAEKLFYITSYRFMLARSYFQSNFVQFYLPEIYLSLIMLFRKICTQLAYKISFSPKQVISSCIIIIFMIFLYVPNIKKLCFPSEAKLVACKNTSIFKGKETLSLS